MSVDNRRLKQCTIIILKYNLKCCLREQQKLPHVRQFTVNVSMCQQGFNRRGQKPGSLKLIQSKPYLSLANMIGTGDKTPHTVAFLKPGIGWTITIAPVTLNNKLNPVENTASLINPVSQHS